MSVGKQRQGAAQAKGEWIVRTRRVAIYLRDGFACVYCGTYLHGCRPSEITLDHLRPRSKGGTNNSRNLVTACRSCNSKRIDKPWRVFAGPEAIHRIERFTRRVVNMDMARAIIAGQTGDPVIEAKDLED